MPGLRFWRLLGTGRGETMSLGADLARWALFAVWESDAALGGFLAAPEPAGRWAAAEERWDARLRLLDTRGSWGGVGLRAPAGGRPRHDGARPVAILTRATIRPSRLRAFYAAVPEVQGSLLASPGRIRSVGCGEWPVARQATFSLWAGAAAARDFAYAEGPHRAVVRRTRSGRWYAEELFARFDVETLAGTWGGGDPLAGRPGG